MLAVAYMLLSSVAGHAQSSVNQPGYPIEIRTQDLEAPALTDNWLSYHGDYTGRRYSSLEQITPDNVSQMQLQWAFHSRNASFDGAAPIVVGGVMYVASSNDTFAIDARTGVMLWRYTRQGSADSADSTSVHANRGIAVFGSRLYMVTDDAHLICLDARSGGLVWETPYEDGKNNYGAPSAPLVIRDKIIVGISGGQHGESGSLAAFDASDGRALWRSGMDTFAGSNNLPKELETLRNHCGTAMWVPGTYDPSQRALYWSIGHFTPPLNGSVQPGEGQNANCLLALDPETGKLKWHSELTPHEHCDNGAPRIPVLVDVTYKGSLQRAIIESNANGSVDVIDRETGTILSKSGERCHQAANVAWNVPAFNERTHLFYFLRADESNIHSPGTGSSVSHRKSKVASGEKPFVNSEKATILAYNLASEREEWRNSETGTNVAPSSLLTTAAGLLLFGGAQSFRVADATSGKLLWHFNMGQKITAPPISYAIHEKQYFVISAGKDIFAFGLS